MVPTAVDTDLSPAVTSTKVSTKNENAEAFTTNELPNGQYLLDRNLNKNYPVVVRGDGNYLFLEDGRRIFDTSSGAAVSCLGHNEKRVIEQMNKQLDTGVPYIPSLFYRHRLVDQLCEHMIRDTDHKMKKVYLTGSGSEAMEATIKLARQYFWESNKETKRVNFIARQSSYHGNTIGALGISGHAGRRAPYLPFLMDNVEHISDCNPYRQRLVGESNEHFVERKAAELEAKFQELGPDTVIGFIMEPIVGAAMGCVPYVPGYMKAMREVCHRHGALFILDEVMCGMGRTGTLHAWQAEDVVPDLQTVGKGLGGGYQPIAAVYISEKVVNTVTNGSGQFIHGQTYQAMPVQASAALAVQTLKRDLDLVTNVRMQGKYLEKLLKEKLADHPNVGDIRGLGLFWGLEFVKDKENKIPFGSSQAIAQKIHDLAISEPHNIVLYPGTGCAGGVSGDHVMICPAYIVQSDDIEVIANTTASVVRSFFENLDA
ncbi:PLP-dependent transferase-5 [Coleophoma cylindrospora]|uniref:PLP-dependent transferase-5 n=1 Tax=Coleophoma cylindrospora TaxID=1849047 RepID=A0A3D8RBJ0_9HELO|nr:PLP-dependent transferase-5 [Coleophoma cylindrospora]